MADVTRKIVTGDPQPDGGGGVVSGAGSKGLTPAEKLDSNNTISSPDVTDQDIAEINADLGDRYDHERYYEGNSGGGNTGPVANDDAATLENDSVTGQSVIIDVLANDTDAESNPLTINSFTQPANGTVTQVGQTLQYQANAGYDGLDAFTYDCTDGSLVSNTANVNVTVDLRPTAADDAASVDNDSKNLDGQGVVIIDVLANDTVAPSKTLTINSFTQPTNGTVTQVGQTLQYQADAGYDGADSFTYDCTDGTLVSNTGTVNMTVNLTTRTMEIGATGDYADWQAFRTSVKEDYAGYDTVGSLPLTVIFQAGEIHDVGRYEALYFADGINVSTDTTYWQSVADGVTITSDGFTGIPYGETGGNSCYVRMAFGDDGFGHGSNTSHFCNTINTDAVIKWTELEIDLPTSNGVLVGGFEWRYTNNTNFLMDRCICRSYTATSSSNGMFTIREDYGTIKIMNSLFYDINVTGTASGGWIYMTVGANEATDSVRVYNNTVVKSTVDSDASFLVRCQRFNKLDFKNNVIDCDGTHGWTLGSAAHTGNTGVNDFTFADANPDTITSSGSSPSNFTSGENTIRAGMRLKVTGTASNDGEYTVASVTSSTITLDAGDSLTAETIGTGAVLVGSIFTASDSEGNVVDDDSGSTSDTNNVDVYTSAGNTSDVYTDVDAFDFSHKVTSPAINAATTLTVAEGIAIDEVSDPDLAGNNRVQAGPPANWDSGATTYNTA